MKNLFDEAFYRRTSAELAALDPRFDAARFLAHSLDDLGSRELMARLQRTAEAFHCALPLPFAGQLAVLHAHTPRIGRAFIALWPCAFVATYGLEQPDISLSALREFTRYGSAEFAIRPFIERDPSRTLPLLLAWASDPDEHIRRLASEGSRPRLPWGRRLTSLVADPSPAFPILETLRADPSLYVRKSVANHLNDIAKDHPEVALDLVSSWDRSDARTAWIIRHALRTLIKRGHPRALTLIGAGTAAKLDIVRFQAAPRKLTLGDTLTLTATLTSRAAKSQRLVMDYVLHYARAGKTAQKVFKWKTLDLPPRATITLTKRQVIRDFSTRRHHAGRHLVELQINGRRLAETAFTLSCP